MRYICFLLFLFIASSCSGQPVDQLFFQELKYRMIGPFRAGRTVGAVGIPHQPNVFFIGVNNGGVWKTDDYGRTWIPVFDQNPTGSIGDLAVALSNPDIIYVGTGEGLHRPDLSVGDGIFKSIDGGRTWSHSGLEDVQQVARVIVHPANPDVVYVAGLGHPYGPNETRGVFRSRDGGLTWQRILFINSHTGSTQVEFDPQDPNTLYAHMWEHQEGPWENASFSGTHSGLYKSNDGGDSWHQLTGGLPGANEGLGRIGIGISSSDPNRIYATVDAVHSGGIYRSDDTGESWQLIQTDGRLWGRGSDFAEIKVHPQNPDLVFVANIAAYKSSDGGFTWSSFKGAPGGDDYHRIWINPVQPQIMLFAADQGAIITVNGGKTWSSWYNQPTAQLYHVSTDNQYPYWVYGGQQESGAIAIASRGNGGQISFRDWMGVGADEYAYVAPDPNDANIVYGGRVIRYNKETGQSQYVGPEAIRSGDVRYLRTMPLMFHPADNKSLLFATNVLWKTVSGGKSWEVISPDLTRKQPIVPASVGDFKTSEMDGMPRRSIIYALAPSPIERDIIWAGTDDGLVHFTKDGALTWQDVTPPGLTSWDKVSQIDAGHFSTGTAYIAVNAFRKDDLKPHIYRTHDFGKTWQEITTGLYNKGPVNVVREDPVQPGLLYAGTEREVFFSIDDGDHWQSLRLNMPATSIRDLVIHDQDLVIGTHGRSIWILDDVTPLRGLKKTILSDQIILLKPARATRVRNNMFLDTPLPPEEPTGENPPDGAVIDYYLPDQVRMLKLEILDRHKKLVRQYSSDDINEQVDSTQLPHPLYWIRPPLSLSTKPGHHRFIWNLRYQNPSSAKRTYSISAVRFNTASTPVGPFVHPGSYIVRLTAGEQILEQVIEVRMDPRVYISESDLLLQTQWSQTCYHHYQRLQQIRDEIDVLLADNGASDKHDTLLEFRGEGDPEDGDFIYGSIREVAIENETIVSLQEKFLYLLAILQSADVPPTNQLIAGIKKLEDRLSEVEEIWKRY